MTAERSIAKAVAQALVAQEAFSRIDKSGEGMRVQIQWFDCILLLYQALLSFVAKGLQITAVTPNNHVLETSGKVTEDDIKERIDVLAKGALAGHFRENDAKRLANALFLGVGKTRRVKAHGNDQLKRQAIEQAHEIRAEEWADLVTEDTAEISQIFKSLDDDGVLKLSALEHLCGVQRGDVLPPPTSSKGGLVLWGVRDDPPLEPWIFYAEEPSKALEAALWNKTPEVKLMMNGTQYILNLNKMTQVPPF